MRTEYSVQYLTAAFLRFTRVLFTYQFVYSVGLLSPLPTQRDIPDVISRMICSPVEATMENPKTESQTLKTHRGGPWAAQLFDLESRSWRQPVERSHVAAGCDWPRNRLTPLIGPLPEDGMLCFAASHAWNLRKKGPISIAPKATKGLTPSHLEGLRLRKPVFALHCSPAGWLAP